MQDRYVGDIGDFANNGLLRWLCGKPELPGCHPDSPVGKLKLGVVEYFNEPTVAEAKNRDGKRIQYLCTCPVICGPDNKRDYRDCDVPLYDALKGIVEDEERNVGEVRRRGILPCPCASYYCAPIYGQVDRGQWLKEALEKVKGAEVVFLNPDKGIALEKQIPASNSSPEHVYMDELKHFVKRMQSLVIYHHFDRSGSQGKAPQQLKTVANRLVCELGAPRKNVYVLWWHREIARFLFVVAHPKHWAIIRKRLEAFGKSDWCAKPREHFDLYKEPWHHPWKP